MPASTDRQTVDVKTREEHARDPQARDRRSVVLALDAGRLNR
jgi:hypothetical protein